MANLRSNPWSITAADVVTATITALTQQQIPSIVNMTTSGAHGLTANSFATILNVTPAGFDGFYKVLAVPTTTTAILQNLQLTAFLTYVSGGNVYKNLYNAQVRIEDMSWQNGTAGDEITLVDRAGNLLWTATCPAGSGTGTQNRGKLFWVNGITPVAIPSGVVLVTIN